MLLRYSRLTVSIRTSLGAVSEPQDRHQIA
jgi:hypothetical protein